MTTCLYKAVFLISTLFAAAASAQLPQYALNRVQEEGGLRTADVTNMARDAKGFLWLSTQSAVFGFDGRHTLRFPFTETVTRVSVDRDQRKWVSTRAGLYLFSEATQRFTPIPFEGAGKTDAAQWYQLPNGAVCALRSGKHFVFDEVRQQFTVKPLPFSNQVRISHYFGHHQQWAFYGNSDTIVRYHASGQLSTIAVKNINGVFVMNAAEVLVSDTRYRTYYVNFLDATVRLLHTPAQPGFGEKLVCYSSASFNDKIWLASNKGLFQYDTKTATITRPVLYYQGRPFDNQSSVSALLTDAEGTLYMNSAEGIFVLNKTSGFIQHVRNYQYGQESLPGNDVRNFTEDEKGNVWLATTGGIAQLNPVTGCLKSFNPLSGRGLIDYPSYRQLLTDGKLLWIGTSGNGIWYYNRKTGVCQRPAFIAGKGFSANDFEQAYIWKLVKLANGRLLAVSGSHLFLIDVHSLQAEAIKYKTEGVSRSALQDASGRIWQGTTAGLICFDTTFKSLFRLRDSLPDKRVAAFCEWKPNHMLIGSRGLFEVKLQGNKIVSFAQKKTIRSEQFIYCMKQDRQGFVWLGTDDGIYRYNPVKDEAVQFDASNGVQSQAFNSDGAFLSSGSVMYMGGKNGFNYFRPDAYAPVTETLQPFVLSVAVNINDSIYTRLPGRIPFHGHNLDFVISAPELKKPFRIQYRYRLGYSDAWTHTGFNNHVRISSLQAGDYNLQVAASYDGRQWFNSKEILSFSLLNPWWQTWWFSFLCIATIAFALWRWSVYRRRRRETVEMKRLIEYFTYSGSADASVDLILWDIACNCISRLGFEDCVIYLLDEKRNVLVQKSAYGAKNPAPFLIANPIEIPVGKGITGAVAKSGEAVVSADTAKDARYIIDDAVRLSEIAVPLVHDGRVIGVIDSEHRKKDFFTRHHLKALQTVASLCASKIATAQALEAVRKAEGDLQLLDAKITEAKFTNLRLQMNPHFLFNILTTIQYLIISNQVHKATRYVDIFSGFLRSLLDHAKDTVVTLEEELRILKLYVELESLCLDETFEWTIDVVDDIDKEDVLVPFMLLQPFVENAIHHGLIHKQGTKKFSIQVDESGDSLCCIVEDNGIGRSAAAGINGRSLSKVVHQSKGIGIVEKRLSLLQQKTGKQACFTIEDLRNNGIASGTRVQITIPNYITEEI